MGKLEQEHIQTIQKTSKKYKALRAIGNIMFFGGLVVALIVVSLDKTPVISGVFVGIGLVINTYAKLMAWWHHG